MRTLIIVVTAMLSVSTPALGQTPQLDAAANRAIEHVTGDLYRFRSGKQHSLFLVTRDGIVVVDPLGFYAASWLNKELQTRFPNTRVRYVVFTHHHADRAGGAGVLKPETIVGHQSFGSALADTRSRGGADLSIIAPAITFQDRHTIEVGGHTIDLIHAGPFHSRDLVAVVFRQERLLLLVDGPPVGQAPFAIAPRRIESVVKWFTAIAPADVDTVMLGDGTMTTGGRIAALAPYLRDMYRAVLDAYERGYSLEKTVQTVQLGAHRAAIDYAGREQQITAIYRQVRFIRGDLVLSGIANYLPEREPAFCAGYDHCEAGGVVPAGTATAMFSFGRRLGLQAEFLISDQFFSSRAKPLYDEETALKPFLASGLIRINVTRSRSVSLLAGVTRVKADVKGVDRVSGIFLPRGGRHAIEEADVRGGFTAGLEFSKRVGAMRLVVPLRVTAIRGTRPEFWPSRLNASAGAGLAFPLFRILE